MLPFVQYLMTRYTLRAIKRYEKEEDATAKEILHLHKLETSQQIHSEEQIYEQKQKAFHF